MAKVLGNTLDTPDFIAALNSERSSPQIAKDFGVHESTVRRRRGKAGIEAPKPEAKTEQGWEAGVSYDPNTGALTEIRTPPMLDVGADYQRVLDAMNIILDEGYEMRLVNLFYNQSAWTRDTEDQEKAVTRPTVRYHFKVVQVVEDIRNEEDIEASILRARKWKLPKRTPGTGLGVPIAAVCNLADMQAYKSEAAGIEALEQRLLDGLENFDNYVKRQRKNGRNIDEVVLVNNGDPFEGIGGNYANQTHTVMGGLRAQMNFVSEIWETYSRQMFPQFDKGQFVSVLCNHTEFGRQGGAKKSLTGDEDNGSAFLAESLRRTLRGRSEFDHVKWTIPHDEMNVYTEIAGVRAGFNHGHKIPGTGEAAFEKWLNGQARGSRDAWDVELWITAHKHQLAFWDLGSASVFQCPSCENESKWLRDMTGRFSRSGVLGLLVGRHESMGWSDPVLL